MENIIAMVVLAILLAVIIIRAIKSTTEPFPYEDECFGCDEGSCPKDCPVILKASMRINR